MPYTREIFRDPCSLDFASGNDDDALHEGMRRAMVWVFTRLEEDVAIYVALTEALGIERGVIGRYGVRIVVFVRPVHLRPRRHRDGRRLESVVLNEDLDLALCGGRRRRRRRCGRQGDEQCDADEE